MARNEYNNAPIKRITADIKADIQSSDIEKRKEAFLQILEFAPKQHGETAAVRVIFDEDKLQLRARESELPVSDPNRFQTCIGLGTSQAYVVELADALGMKLNEPSVLDDVQLDKQEFLGLEFDLSEVSFEGDVNIEKINALMGRRTIRGPYSISKITQDFLVGVEEMGNIDLTHVHIEREEETISQMADMAYEGFKRKLRVPNFVKEMFHSLVAKNEIKTADTGMDPRGFFSMGKRMPLLPRTVLNGASSFLDSSKNFIAGLIVDFGLSRDQMKEVANTPAYYVYHGKGENLLDYVNAGLDFGRFWLRAWEAGVSIQPTQIFVEEESANRELVELLGLDPDNRIMLTARIGEGKDLSEFPIPPKKITPYYKEKLVEEN